MLQGGDDHNFTYPAASLKYRKISFKEDPTFLGGPPSLQGELTFANR